MIRMGNEADYVLVYFGALAAGLITDLIGNPVKLADGTRYTDAQHQIADYSLGKRWTARPGKSGRDSAAHRPSTSRCV